MPALPDHHPAQVRSQGELFLLFPGLIVPRRRDFYTFGIAFYPMHIVLQKCEIMDSDRQNPPTGIEYICRNRLIQVIEPYRQGQIIFFKAVIHL